MKCKECGSRSILVAKQFGFPRLLRMSVKALVKKVEQIYYDINKFNGFDLARNLPPERLQNIEDLRMHYTNRSG